MINSGKEKFLHEEKRSGALFVAWYRSMRSGLPSLSRVRDIELSCFLLELAHVLLGFPYDYLLSYSRGTGITNTGFCNQLYMDPGALASHLPLPFVTL